MDHSRPQPATSNCNFDTTYFQFQSATISSSKILGHLNSLHDVTSCCFQIVPPQPISSQLANPTPATTTPAHQNAPPNHASYPTTLSSPPLMRCWLYHCHNLPAPANLLQQHLIATCAQCNLFLPNQLASHQASAHMPQQPSTSQQDSNVPPQEFTIISNKHLIAACQQFCPQHRKQDELTSLIPSTPTRTAQNHHGLGSCSS